MKKPLREKPGKKCECQRGSGCPVYDVEDKYCEYCLKCCQPPQQEHSHKPTDYCTVEGKHICIFVDCPHKKEKKCPCPCHSPLEYRPHKEGHGCCDKALRHSEKDKPRCSCLHHATIGKRFTDHIDPCCCTVECGPQTDWPPERPTEEKPRCSCIGHKKVISPNDCICSPHDSVDLSNCSSKWWVEPNPKNWSEEFDRRFATGWIVSDKIKDFIASLLERQIIQEGIYCEKVRKHDVDQAKQEAREKVIEEIRSWSEQQYCMCEGRKHDKENLMAQLQEKLKKLTL